MIRNLIPHEITILREGDGPYVGTLGYGPTARDARFELVWTYLSEGVARATTQIHAVGTFDNHGNHSDLDDPDGIPIIAVEYGPPEGLPAMQQGVWLIVSEFTARSAAHHGRDIGDLLTVGEKVRDGAGRVIGCINLQVMSASDGIATAHYWKKLISPSNRVG